MKVRRVRTELSILDMPRTARLTHPTPALNGPVKSYSPIHACKKMYQLNIAKYIIEITKLR